MEAQRGFALLEAVAVIAVLALGAGTLLLAMSAAAKLGPTPERNRAAAAILAAQTLRTAENAWKYGSPGNAPSGSAAALLPVPGFAAPIPVTISSTVDSQSANGAALTVTVSYPSGSVSQSQALRVRAPLPGTQVERPGLIAQPAGTL